MEIQTNSTKSITLGIGPHDELVTQMGELEIKILMMMASHALLGICFLRGAPLLKRCSNTMKLTQYIATGDSGLRFKYKRKTYDYSATSKSGPLFCGVVMTLAFHITRTHHIEGIRSRLS
jgi:hypothetical protein